MGGLLLSLLAFFLVPVAGLLAVKNADQKSRDHNRKSYLVSLPSPLDEHGVTAWLRSISGTLKSNSSRLTGVPTVAFEMWATSAGIQHRVKVPWQHADYVMSQLQGHVPGIRYEREQEYPRRLWTRAVEVGLTNTSRKLRIFSAPDVATSLLKAVYPVGRDETVLMQWIVTPAIPRHAPLHKEARSHDITLKRLLVSGVEANRDEVNDRRSKLEEPNMLAVLRVAAVADTPIRADHLIYRVRAALASTRTASTRFKRRLVRLKTMQERIDRVRGSLNFPMQLSASELTALIAWPIGNPYVSGLPQPMARQFPPTQLVPTKGIVIGTSAFPGSERPIAIPYEQALMHTHVLGKIGTGKSNLLSHMARQIMNDGYGLIVMETEGNLYQSVLDYVPNHRVDDVILLDVSDRDYPVGFNVLDQGNPLAVIDQVIDLFLHKYGKEGMGVWAQEYLYHGLRTIAATPNLSFTDLATLLNPRTTEEIDWVDDVTRSLKDAELRRWWQMHDNRDRRQQQQRAEPVLSRIWQLASRPELRCIMGQSKSTFQVNELLSRNKILLVNLKGVSRDTASLAGTLLMNAIWQSTKTVAKAKPTYLILDEFADYMDIPVDTETMLAQSRKHGLGMILANQHMMQLKPGVRDAVISNTRSKVVFQSNADDAKMLGRDFGKQVEVEDFTLLRTYEALAKVQTDKGTTDPISIRTIAPLQRAGNARTVIASSRGKYSKRLAEVHAEIENRHKMQPKRSARRPAIGTATEWGQQA